MQMPLNQRIDKENVVHLHNGTLLSEKKNAILKFAGKWLELEKKNILSEVTMIQKANIVCTHSQVDTKHKAKDNQATIHNLRETREKRGH